MNIYYDGVDSPMDMLTFTDVPNILKLNEEVSGTKALFQFFIGQNIKQTVTGDNQYHITLFGETISNVMSPQDANNKRFYISNNALSTAMSIAKAFRDCASLNADYNIYVSPAHYAVVLHARTIGKKLTMSNYLDMYIPNVGTSFSQDGTPDPTSPSLTSLFQSKINVDVYSGATVDGDNYVTTLEKNWYGDECAFDVSPVLSTFSEYGKSVKYCFNIQSVLANGEYSQVGTVSGNSTIGYVANQSENFLILGDTQLLMNKHRGDSSNPITFYIYENKIPYSVLLDEGVDEWNFTVKLYDSSNSLIVQYQLSGEKSDPNSVIADYEFEINQQYFDRAFYVDLYAGNDMVRFEVIKPLKAAETFQRVLWRNEYGGISFFDFTGARSETDSVDTSTYEKNIFDYYDNYGVYERKQIYSNGYNKQVTLTSHLLKEDGKWIFNSLMKSKKVWTIINDKTYYIIPKSISVDEDGTYNGIYTAKLTYTYSQE